MHTYVFLHWNRQLRLLSVLQFQVVFFDPSDFSEQISDNRGYNSRQDKADHDQAEPVHSGKGKFRARRDIIQPACINADLSHQAAGAHAGGYGGAVHLQFEQAGRGGAGDSGSDDRGNPDLRIFYDIAHLQHGSAEPLRDQAAPFVFRKTHHGKADHIGTASGNGGAAVAGCCANMVGFAVMSFPENKWGGLISQGLGTSMLQMGNIVKNPKIWIPPIVASAIAGPAATCLFKLQMNGTPVSSGMGTCGLVGQIGVYAGWLNDIAAGTKLSLTAMDWFGLIMISFILPAVISSVVGNLLRKIGWIKENDLKLEN